MRENVGQLIQALVEHPQVRVHQTRRVVHRFLVVVGQLWTLEARLPTVPEFRVRVRVE